MDPEILAGVTNPTELSPATVTDSPLSETPEASPSSSEQDNPVTPVSGDEPKSVADAIEAALKAAPKDASETPAEEGADGQTPKESEASDNTEGSEPDQSKETVEGDGADKAEDGDPTDAELKTYGPGAQKRIKQLLSQRNELRRETETLQTDAGNYRQVREFMTRNRLEDREVAELFQLGADLKSGDPARLKRFVDRAMPTLTMVLEAIGQAVPADLNERVQSGEMTEDAAKELARHRYTAQTAQEAAERAAADSQRQSDTVRQQEIMSAVEQWQSSMRASDPDFGMKADAMKRAAQAMVAERGLPRTKQEALDMAKAAYVEVNQWFKSSRPAPKPTAATPASGVSASRTTVQPAPTSLDDVIKQAIATATRS